MRRYLTLAALIAFFPAFNLMGADEPVAATKNDAIIERLDMILKRLDAIERRLSWVEADTCLFADWTVDARGVMRLPDGRPVGFWGIDGPMPITRY